MNLIKVEHLTKVYNNGVPFKALDNVSFEVKKGDFLAILGASGSGKSTLLHLLSGLDDLTEGNIKIDDIALNSLSEEKKAVFRKEYIGFVFQAFNLVSFLNTLDNVCLPSKFVKSKQGLAQELLAKVGLAGKELNLPSQLSGGEKQRVSIARALINEPYILMADEPTGNLDSYNRNLIMDLFQELNNQGMTIVMVTHNQDTLKYCNKIIELKDGRIINFTERSIA